MNPRAVLPAYSLSRGAPYSHLGTSASAIYPKTYVPKKVAERVGFEPTALDESPVFKTGSLNHSDISPHLFQSEANKIIPHRTPFVNPPEPAFQKTIVFLLQVLQRRSFRHPLLAFDHAFGIQIADLGK